MERSASWARRARGGLGAAVLAAALLSGCGSPPASATKERAPGTVSLAASATAAERSGHPARTDLSVEQLTPFGAEGAWASLVCATCALGKPFPQEVVRTTDGGVTWQVLTPPGLATATGDRYINGEDFLDAGHAWVVYGSIVEGRPQTLVSTSDGGRRWTTLGRLPSPVCEVQFVTPSDGWCTVIGEEMGRGQVIVYRSVDGGRRWTLVSKAASLVAPAGATGSPGSLPVGCDKAVTFLTPTQGWAGFDCVGYGMSPLYETTDAGWSWHAAVVDAPPTSLCPPDSTQWWTWLPSVAGADGAAGLLCDASGHDVSLVYRSTDGGETWQPVVAPGAARDWSIDLVSATDWKLIFGREILATDDAGQTWRKITSSAVLPWLPGYVGFTTSEVGWRPVVGGADNVHRTTDGGATWRHVTIPGVGS